MRYKKPALAEILVKITLVPGAVPESQFFDFARPLFDLGLSDREIVSAAEFQPGPAVGINPRLRFWDPDRKRLVQLARDAIGINNVAPYIGWPEFSSFVSSVIDTLQKHGLPSAFTSAELCAIDKFRVSSEEYRFGDWLNADGRYIPTFYSDCTTPCDIQLGLGAITNDGFNTQLHIHVRPRQEHFEFEIRCVLAQAFSDSSILPKVLESAHGKAVEMFEAMITDNVRNEIMGGVSQ